jgi:hypothetical protein
MNEQKARELFENVRKLHTPDRPTVTSELAPTEQQAQSARCSVAVGSGWVSAGLLLQMVRAWEKTANKEKHEAELCLDHTNMVGHFAIHGAYKTAANELRLLVEDASVRQPTPNTSIARSAENEKP